MNMLTRRLKLVLILLISILWFVVFIPYFVLQTHFGATLLSGYLSDDNTYSWKIGTISHAITSPSEVTLNHVSVIDNATGNTLLQTEKLVLGLKSWAIWNNTVWEYVIIQNGQLYLSSNNRGSDLLQTQRLQLLNVSTQFEHDGTVIHIENANGGVKPWMPKDPKDAIEFNFTAEKAEIDNLTINSLVVSGLQKNGTLFFNNIGGNIHDGFFISKAKQLADSSWQIDELQINHVNLQNHFSLEKLLTTHESLPTFKINYFNLIDSSLDLPDFKVEKGNIELRNLAYNQGWIFDNTPITFNAQSIVWRNELFSEPMLHVIFDHKNINIEKALSRWSGGILSLDGIWHDNQLDLNQLLISSIHYTLPQDWFNWIKQTPLPDYLNQITVAKLSLTPSIIIDTQTDFPMQFTSIEADGDNLALAQNNHFDLYQGNLNIKADHATVNTITLRYADLSINVGNEDNQDGHDQSFSHDTHTFHTMFNALTDNGILEAIITAKPATKTLTELTLVGHNVDPQLLSLWHIIDNPTKEQNFTLSVTGSYEPMILSGEMSNKLLHNVIHHTIENNRIVTIK